MLQVMRNIELNIKFNLIYTIMENHQKIEEISRQIAEIDGELASLFDQIIRNMDFENRLNHNLDANN